MPKYYMKWHRYNYDAKRYTSNRMTRLVESNKEVTCIAVNQKPGTTIGTRLAESRKKAIGTYFREEPQLEQDRLKA